MDGLVRARMT